jgi:hypothetical protein
MKHKYNDFEIWEYIRGLPFQVEQTSSTEGSHIVQQVVDEWAAHHKDVVERFHVEWRRDPKLYEIAERSFSSAKYIHEQTNQVDIQ